MGHPVQSQHILWQHICKHNVKLVVISKVNLLQTQHTMVTYGNIYYGVQPVRAIPKVNLLQSQHTADHLRFSLFQNMHCVRYVLKPGVILLKPGVILEQRKKKLVCTVLQTVLVCLLHHLPVQIAKMNLSKLTNIFVLGKS